MMRDGQQAVALQIIAGRSAGRFFAGVRKRRVCTAWSLAGARLFGEWRTDEIGKARAQMARRGLDVVAVRVVVA